jgi:hypothetical protein
MKAATSLHRLLPYVAFVLLLFHQQLRYFFPTTFIVPVSVGLGLALLSLLFFFRKLKLTRTDFVLLLAWALIICLHGLDLVNGKTPEANYLIFYALAEFYMALLIIHKREDASFHRFLRFVIVIAFLMEASIALLQYSFFQTGFGLKPVNEEYEAFFMISGSYFNGNDLSVFLATAFFIIYYSFRKIINGYLMYILMLAVSILLFIANSRSVMALYLFFVLAHAFRQLKGARSGLLPTILVCVALIVGGNFLYERSLESGGETIDKKIERMVAMADMAHDESIQDRSIAYYRFAESLPTLGIGTFEMNNYDRYYESYDFNLLKKNPHNFIIEMSFLYGWLGLAASLLLMGSIIKTIFTNRTYTAFDKLLLVSALLLFVGVPSGILKIPCFFVYFTMIAYASGDSA